MEIFKNYGTINNNAIQLPDNGLSFFYRFVYTGRDDFQRRPPAPLRAGHSESEITQGQ
jgi:hypothetical protein